MTRGGRFLEAPVIGSKQLAKDGQLVVIASGDKSLYDDCQSCLQAMARHIFYLGERCSLCTVALYDWMNQLITLLYVSSSFGVT